MRDFDFIVSPAKLLTPEIVQMVSSIHEHKGKQELFLEANVDELKTLLILLKRLMESSYTNRTVKYQVLFYFFTMERR